MDVLETAQNAVSEYHDTYRHPNLATLQVQGLYELFPAAGSQAPLRWPGPWPYVDQPGVYLIFDAELKLLYVGKDARLGRRLGTYFQYQAGRGTTCRIVDALAWGSQPAFVATVAVSKTFEAPSLEEYLIAKLRPSLNKLWATRDGAA